MGHSKEPLIVVGTPGSSRRLRGADLHQKSETYVSDITSTFLFFVCDAEASALLFGEDFNMIHIRTEADHVRLCQKNDMKREHGTVWVAINNAVELSQKRVEEAIVTTLKTQVSKIDSYTKIMESAVTASIRKTKEPAYTFIELCRWI